MRKLGSLNKGKITTLDSKNTKMIMVDLLF